MNKSKKWMGILAVTAFFATPALVWKGVRFESRFRAPYAPILDFTPNVVALVTPKEQVIPSFIHNPVIHNPVRQDSQVSEPNSMTSDFPPITLENLASVDREKPIRVSMIWQEEKNRVAIIDQQVVREGQSIREYRVDHIEKDGVLLVGEKEKIWLPID